MLIERWLRLDQRLRQRNKIAVVSFLFSTYLPVARAKVRASSRENRKIHRVSSVAGVIISGDSVLNDSRKDLAKEVNMDLARFTLEPHGVLVPNCLRHWCFKRVVLDCGATETAGVVEAVQILVDAMTQGFPDSRIQVDSLDFAKVTGAGLFQESGF